MNCRPHHVVISRVNSSTCPMLPWFFAFSWQPGSVIGSLIGIVLPVYHAQFHCFQIKQTVVSQLIIFCPRRARRTRCPAYCNASWFASLCAHVRINPATFYAIHQWAFSWHHPINVFPDCRWRHRRFRIAHQILEQFDSVTGYKEGSVALGYFDLVMFHGNDPYSLLQVKFFPTRQSDCLWTGSHRYAEFDCLCWHW